MIILWDIICSNWNIRGSCISRRCMFACILTIVTISFDSSSSKLTHDRWICNRQNIRELCEICHTFVRRDIKDNHRASCLGDNHAALVSTCTNILFIRLKGHIMLCPWSSVLLSVHPSACNVMLALHLQPIEGNWNYLAEMLKILKRCSERWFQIAQIKINVTFSHYDLIFEILCLHCILLNGFKEIENTWHIIY